MMTARSSRRLLTFISWLLATAGLIVAACFAVNCLIDPLWYLRGNVLTEINYPFNERLSKIVRLLPRLPDYDCIIFGTSRATLLPEDKIAGYRCFNLAVSDGQASEYLVYADYLRKRGFDPKLLIVEVRRGDLIGPIVPPEVPEFIPAGEAPPSILASYLSLDALNFSVRTLKGDTPHHRYYDQDFGAQLEVRSKRHYYNPPVSIKPTPPPFDVHPERADLYVQLRQKFPMARAVGYVPPESAWRIAAFSLTGGFDAYLGAIGRIAAAYDQFLDFSIPSAMTQSKDPADTYDGVHYSRGVNGRVLAALIGSNSDLAIDWRSADAPTVIADYHDRLAQFVATTTRADAGAKNAKGSPKSEASERD
jgi:hypothetical protein